MSKTFPTPKAKPKQSKVPTKMNQADLEPEDVKDELTEEEELLMAEKAKQDIANSEQSIQDSLETAKDERRQMIIDAKDAASKFREEEIQND